ELAAVTADLPDAVDHGRTGRSLTVPAAVVAAAVLLLAVLLGTAAILTVAGWGHMGAMMASIGTAMGCRWPQGPQTPGLANLWRLARVQHRKARAATPVLGQARRRLRPRDELLRPASVPRHPRLDLFARPRPGAGGRHRHRVEPAPLPGWGRAD